MSSQTDAPPDHQPNTVQLVEALNTGADQPAVEAGGGERRRATRKHYDNPYEEALEILAKASGFGVNANQQAQIESVRHSGQLPQLICRDLLAQKTITNIQLARALARALKRKDIQSFLDIPPEANQLRAELPNDVVRTLRDNRMIPFKLENKDSHHILHIAHEDTTRDLVLEASLKEYLPDHDFVWHFCTREVAGAFWLSGTHEDVDTGMEAEALLDRIIGNAIDARSSDIHIDPETNKGEIRAMVKYRIDGSVVPKEIVTAEQLDRLKVRIENLARMPKVNMYHPNKGSFTRAGYDWRVQIQPHSSSHGAVPRMVLRRLKPDVMPMEALGYPTDFIEKIKSAAMAPNGVIFWTGPTSSGKTESIHSAIISSNPMARGLSVHTIEDPPEKRVKGYALQMEAVEEDEPRSAYNLMKSSLRADPDVIVLGEVRDRDMAKLAFEAANTGHLVFTTLHTNTALDAIVRLDELGITGFLLSYIRGIAAQRLVRRLCNHCRQPMTEPDEYTRYVFDRYGVDMEGAQLYKANPEGCANCNFQGYHGMIAAAEWLSPSKEIIDASNRHEFEDLEDMARRTGWQPMGYMATLHVKNGITDADEISRKILELSSEIY